MGGKAEKAPLDAVQLDILEVAVAEFAEHGLAGARVDAIAARTSTSKRMLYYHFGSKEGLYTAALEHAYASIRDDPPPPDLDALAPMDALRAYTGYVFDLHVTHPAFVHMVMGENLLGGRFVRQIPGIRERNLEGVRRLERVIERGRKGAVMRRDLDVMDLYTSIVALAFHFVSNRPTFSAIFEASQTPEAVRRRRRACVVDAIARQAMALPEQNAASREAR